MKATIPWAGALLGTALATSLACASDYWYPASRPVYPAAPDACGPGFYSTGPQGMVYGPSYWLQPPGAPFTMSGALPQGGSAKAWPTNPYVRGPRDFFMWRDTMEDQMRRNVRPNLVP